MLVGEAKGEGLSGKTTADDENVELEHDRATCRGEMGKYSTHGGEGLLRGRMRNIVDAH